MNWPLFWALILTFGVVISNILLIRHAAKLKMPSTSKLAEGNKGYVSGRQHSSLQSTYLKSSSKQSSSQQSPAHDQTPNSPE